MLVFIHMNEGIALYTHVCIHINTDIKDFEVIKYIIFNITKDNDV